MKKTDKETQKKKDMSAKAGKRSRKVTVDELDPDFKIPGASKAKDDTPKSAKDEPDANVPESNGLQVETSNGENGDVQNDSPARVIQTRSRSNTPLIKTPEPNGTHDEPNNSLNEADSVKNDESVAEVDTNGLKDEVSEAKDLLPSDQNGKEEAAAVPRSTSTDLIEPIVEEDDIDELKFDENDLDLESEGSPSRCQTRRSQTRNVSTPKTPKLVTDQELENKSAYVPLERLPEEDVSGRSTPKKVTSSNDSNVGSSESQPDEIVDFDTSDTYSSVSTDNISTRAVAGSDATRNIDLTYQDSGLFEENSLTSSNRSLGETLRNLSPRRTIRPITSDYRRMAMQNNLDGKNDVYADYEAVERISSGTKRKNRSVTPDMSKRFKKETPGLLSYLSNIKDTLHRSSTPKLIGYEKKGGLEDDGGKISLEIGDNENGHEKKWCSIM